MEEELQRLFDYLLENSKPLEPEFAQVVEDDFWDLLTKTQAPSDE